MCWCTLITCCQLWDLAWGNISGGKNIWPSFNWYAFINNRLSHAYSNNTWARDVYIIDHLQALELLISYVIVHLLCDKQETLTNTDFSHIARTSYLKIQHLEYENLKSYFQVNYISSINWNHSNSYAWYYTHIHITQKSNFLNQLKQFLMRTNNTWHHKMRRACYLG